jgi:hydroxymethylbilane synthase
MSEESQTKSIEKIIKTHFKIGSRKSKLAMVQAEYILDQLSKKHVNYTFEIVNFETKGDKILNIALPKIGDKGLFTKELEDSLESGGVDLVVHSLKDMPCQTLPDKLIISGVPEREDPTDALVFAKRWQGVKFSLEDLDDGSVIGTSSLRRISQLKEKYPKLKFDTIRGNLQTRLAKLDDEKNKFDAIVLATAGLNRMGYEDRISMKLPSYICMYAVSQGALGIECRRNDRLVIEMVNELNHEETLLRIIAERTFLAKLEGGCSAPVGVLSRLTESSIFLEGCVLNQSGTERLQEKFEIKFDTNLDSCDCPIVSIMRKNNIKLPSNETVAIKQVNSNSKLEKRKLEDDENSESSNKQIKSDSKLEIGHQHRSVEPVENMPHYSFIMDLKISNNKMATAELCGMHLAEKMKEMGADIIIRECKAQVMNT